MSNGIWREGEMGQPLPGARDMTAAEFIGSSARYVSKMGEWVEVPGEIAASDAEILQWCWKHADSGSPAAGFRFSRRTYEQAGKEAFPIAFVPELHDPRPAVRLLAQTERLLRISKARLARFERQRARHLQVAAHSGLSRRKLAELVGLSFGRVQQLISRLESER